MNDKPPIRSTPHTLTAGTMSPVVRLHAGGAGITAIPAIGGTMRVFKSTSPGPDIEADLGDGTLSYANLLAGSQPTRSTWMLWSSGAVTITTNEGPLESAGDVAVIATATNDAGVLEVTG